jgi:peroxiredoxin
MDTSPTDRPALPDATPAGPGTSRRWWGVVLAAAVIVAAAGALVVATHHNSTSRSGAASATPQDLVGQRLPDVTYTRFDGTTASLGQPGGQPVVLNFWSATCVACRTEMPALERLHRAAGHQVTFVGVDSGDGLSTGRDAARQFGVDYALAFDPQSHLASQLGVVALPTTVVVDSHGVVTHVHVGAVDLGQLRRWIAQAQP